MVKIYTPVIVGEHVEMQEHFLGKYVLVKDFDRAISLLKAQIEVSKKIIEPGDGYAYGYFGQEYTEKIKALKSETEEFLEECNNATGK